VVIERKREERTESEAAQGFTGKMPIVENFFGLQGQEREKRKKRAKKKPRTGGAN